MKKIHFQPDEFPKLALLIKESACSFNQLKEHYVDHFNVVTVALSLEYNSNNKITAKLGKDYLNHILPILRENAINTLYVADAAYFKILTKLQKTEPHYGYVIPCAIEGFTDLNIIYGVNYQALFHNPNIKEKLDLSIKTVVNYFNNTYTEIGLDIIHNAEYPVGYRSIKKILDQLLTFPALTCDIETKGLDLDVAVPATISFAIDAHSGYAFAITSDRVKKAIKEFFTNYQGKLIYHNANFDIRCIIHHIFMADNLDYKGLVDALDIMFRNIEDTKLIAYLCTNSTAGNNLSLKHLAFEYTGNYAQDDIKDITLIPLPDLLQYNLTDCLATWYVYSKYYPKLLEENQLEIYKNLFLPALKNITHMELVGMPLDMDIVDTLEANLIRIQNYQENELKNSQWVKDTEWLIQREEFLKANLVLKKKVKSLDDFQADFNPSSTKQVAKLVYEIMGLPVIDTTTSGEPAVGAKTLKKLIKHLQQEHGISDEDLLT